MDEQERVGATPSRFLLTAAMAEPVRDDGRGRAEPSASEASARAAGDELTGSGMTLNPAVLAGDGAPPRLALPPPASPSHELFADPAASLYAGANRTLLALHAGLLAPGSGRGEDDLRQATTGHDGQLEGLEAAEEQGPSDYRRLLLSRTTSAPTSGDAVSSRLLQALPQLSLSHWLLDVNSQAPHRSSSSAGQSNDLGGNEEPTRNSEESVASPLLPVRQAWAAATPRSRRRSVGSILSRHEIGVRRARDSSQVQSRHSFDAAASGSSNPATTESAATTPVEHTTNDEHADNDDQTAMEELVSLFRRCHHSLPFVALFLIYFAYQHATGILVFVVGTIAIIGLDQRVRTQVALKDKASILQLLGIVGMCAIDMVALCTVDGEPNPFLHFSRMMELSSSHKGALWDVLWIILVNGTRLYSASNITIVVLLTACCRVMSSDFMIRLCSLSIKAIVAAIKSDKLVCRKGPGNDYVLPSDADVDTPSVHSDADDDGIDPLSAAPRATSSVAFYRRKVREHADTCLLSTRALTGL